MTRLKRSGASNVRARGGWKCCEYRPTVEQLAEEMTPDQIAKAERLLAEWEPNPAECEIETAGTTAYATRGGAIDGPAVGINIHGHAHHGPGKSDGPAVPALSTNRRAHHAQTGHPMIFHIQ